jgi:CheY-like chemotaxis protein
LILENNEYQVITANNGIEALGRLSNMDILPDLIISDILMPKMDGINLLEKVSKDPRLNQIPFCFLTGRNSPEEVRLGKILGADDYITKPFDSEDLLAIISGKIARNKKIRVLNQKIDEVLMEEKILPHKIGSEKEKILMHVIWDDKGGEKVVNYYPEKDFNFSIQKIGGQLFKTSISIFGGLDIRSAQSILLKITNINKFGFLYFDFYTDETSPSGQKDFMIACLAPNMTYFDALKLKPIIKDLSKNIKNQNDLNLPEIWEQINIILP